MKYVLILLIALGNFSLWSQYSKRDKTDKIPSYFGIQVKTLFPTKFVGNPVLDLVNNEFHSRTKQSLGYGFGATVRVGFTKLLALETGLHFTQRNYKIEMDIKDSNLFATNNLSFISYELPLNALVYIQLDQNIFMNTALGASINYKPTNVGVLNTPGGNHYFYHTGIINSRVFFDFNASVGFEYRTKKNGFFYLGGSAKVPYQELFTMVAKYENQSYVNRMTGGTSGSYLSIDFKYFFPNIKRSGEQMQQGPIE